MLCFILSDGGEMASSFLIHLLYHLHRYRDRGGGGNIGLPHHGNLLLAWVVMSGPSLSLSLSLLYFLFSSFEVSYCLYSCTASFFSSILFSGRASDSRRPNDWGGGYCSKA
ncbi:hypothetical protein L873DRAFT_347716 [Choiromyces venosus 120613-1]|uniref:Uncharacterized protein n=1 Tax=Choiromyces venosus 120613-1 TaxID=1336337 RepID=A0A3N4IYR4_9PEZI|nr:hypothetical protein L873DRAFT_347716 [Choiromyces venosus 120613-1]